MLTVLNRLRGTEGLWSIIIGTFLGLIIATTIKHEFVAVIAWLTMLGYIIGESFGWGLWVGCLTVHRENTTNKTEDEGKNNGIQWLARKLVPNYIDNFVNYCRVALTIRGFYWWLPTLAPLYFVGFKPLVLLGCIAFLSVGFPIACELGYYFRDKISFEKYGLSFRGGWELQEGFYGLMQDLVIITLIGVSLWQYL